MSRSRLTKSIYTANYQKFLNLLRRCRKDAGLTQVDVAKKLGKPQSFVSKCESGERRVDVAELLAFCNVYGADPCQVIRDLGKSRRRGVDR